MTLQPVNNSSLSASSVVPTHLQHLNLHFQLETPSSLFAIYQQQGRFCTDDSCITAQLEHIIASAFIDEIYENSMHSVTLRNIRGDAVGVVIWRDVDEVEMKGWMKEEWAEQLKQEESQQHSRVQHFSQKFALTHNHGNSTLSTNDSVTDPIDVSSISTELDAAVESLNSQLSSVSMNNASEDDDSILPVNTLAESNGNSNPCRSWIKLELLAIRPQHKQLHLGTILLLACLLYAVAHHKNRSILHVAGGDKNIPAIKLYERFGFQRVADENFNSPNRNMFVLKNIRRLLSQLDLRTILHRPIKKQQLQQTTEAKLLTHNHINDTNQNNNQHAENAV